MYSTAKERADEKWQRHAQARPRHDQKETITVTKCDTRNPHARRRWQQQSRENCNR